MPNPVLGVRERPDLDGILHNAGLDRLGPDSEAAAFQRFFQRVRLDLEGSSPVDHELARRMVEAFLTERGIPDAGRLVAQGLVSVNGNAKATALVERPGLTHIRDLLAEPDDAVSWIVDGLLPAGGLSVLAGKPKGGKSTLARALALRVCRGEPMLGRETERGPVIYLGLEDPRRVTKDHLRTLGARDSDDLYVFTGSRPDEALLWLEGVLAKVDPVLVVGDTLQHLLGVSDLNDYARVVAAFRPILGLVRPRRAHMMLVHHAGKGDRTGFDAILGSTAIVGTVDVALLMRRREDQSRTLASLQRTGEDLPESVVTLNDRQEPQLGPPKQDYDAQQAGERVLAWLDTQAQPVNREAVLEAVEGRAETVIGALRALVDGGRVARTGEGKRGAPYQFQIPFRHSQHRPGTGNGGPRPGSSAPLSTMISVPADSGSDATPVPNIEGSEPLGSRVQPCVHPAPLEPWNRDGWTVCGVCHPDPSRSRAVLREHGS